MMKISMIFIFSALSFYTFSIFKERSMGYLMTWLTIMFFFGFLSDLVGTSIMFSVAKDKFAPHAVCGYIALGVMLVHLTWAILANCKVGNCQHYFTKCSIYAWGLWMIAFITGVPKVNKFILNLF